MLSGWRAVEVPTYSGAEKMKSPSAESGSRLRKMPPELRASGVRSPRRYSSRRSPVAATPSGASCDVRVASSEAQRNGTDVPVEFWVAILRAPQRCSLLAALQTKSPIMPSASILQAFRLPDQNEDVNSALDTRVSSRITLALIVAAEIEPDASRIPEKALPSCDFSVSALVTMK
jgi:hypothetical protein